MLLLDEVVEFLVDWVHQLFPPVDVLVFLRVLVNALLLRVEVLKDDLLLHLFLVLNQVLVIRFAPALVVYQLLFRVILVL